MTSLEPFSNVAKRVVYRSLSTLSPTRSLYYPEQVSEYDELVAQSLTGLTAGLPLRAENKDRWYDYGSSEKITEFVFEKVDFPASRFTDGSFPVWYGADLKETTVCEQAWHKRKWTLFELEGTTETAISYQMVFFRGLLELEPCAEVCDSYQSSLYDSECYDHGQDFGELVRKQGAKGVKFLSRRLKNQINWAVFDPQAILESKAVAFWEMSISRFGDILYCHTSPISFDQDGWCSKFTV